MRISTRLLRIRDQADYYGNPAGNQDGERAADFEGKEKSYIVFIMSITGSAIDELIAAEDDFGHELRVGAAIRAMHGVDVQHRGTYTDAATGKPRQFDYRCSLTKQDTVSRHTIALQAGRIDGVLSPITTTTSLVFAVECQNVSSCFPLIVRGPKRQPDEAYLDLIVCIGRRIAIQRGNDVPVGEHSLVYRAKDNQSLYRPGECVGKRLVRLRPKNPGTSKAVVGPADDISEKGAHAISSAIELVKSAFIYVEPNHLKVSAILPVVVVPDGSLWWAIYDDNGKASRAEQVDQCGYYVGWEVEGLDEAFMFSHIHLFTLRGFSSFLSRMAVNDLAWEAIFNADVLRLGEN
jgi:hypothetical protein